DYSVLFLATMPIWIQELIARIARLLTRAALLVSRKRFETETIQTEPRRLRSGFHGRPNYSTNRHSDHQIMIDGRRTPSRPPRSPNGRAAGYRSCARGTGSCPR